MAGRYGLLTANAGYLGHFATLVTERTTRAEADADRLIDVEFGDYSHATWSPTGRPQEVALVWDLWASAVYLELDWLANNPTSDEAPASITNLQAKALAIVDRAKDRGYLIGSDGLKQEPENSDSPNPGGSTVRLVR